MFYFLISEFITDFQQTTFRLFGYVSFRAFFAMLTAFLICALFGKKMSSTLKRIGALATDRYSGVLDEKYIDHSKDKTPSMGGLLIVASIVTATLLWSRLTVMVLIFTGTLVLFCALGFWDDFTKITSKALHAQDPVKYPKCDGISEKQKLVGQFAISIFAVQGLYFVPGIPDTFTSLYIPFFKQPILSITKCLNDVQLTNIFSDTVFSFTGTSAIVLWIIALVIAFIFLLIVIVGSCNAVNLTDGKDGLAVGCTISCVLTYGIIAYLCGHKIFADYLSIHYIAGASEILVFALSIVGACIGFLWHNCYPASMFMGDTGSLPLGGIIGLIAVVVKQEILLILVGGVFVMEIGSVMIQRFTYKHFQKRLFACTPIHHHFEQKYHWQETQIVVRFWILAGLFALMGLATLKMR